MKKKSITYCSHTGKVRSENQDNFFVNGDFLKEEHQGSNGIRTSVYNIETAVCVSVFDGMGGEQYGEKAAWIAATELSAMFENNIMLTANQISQYCMNANRKICALADSYGGIRIGTTASVMWLYNKSGILCNIGDSKIYRMRNRQLLQCSKDHTDEALMKVIGQKHRRPRLTQYLGIWPEEMIIEPYVQEIELQEGDQYLLCSDGLTDMLSEEDICSILQEESNPVEILLKMALQRGGMDNITIVLCKH